MGGALNDPTAEGALEEIPGNLPSPAWRAKQHKISHMCAVDAHCVSDRVVGRIQPVAPNIPHVLHLYCRERRIFAISLSGRFGASFPVSLVTPSLPCHHRLPRSRSHFSSRPLPPPPHSYRCKGVPRTHAAWEARTEAAGRRLLTAPPRSALHNGGLSVGAWLRARHSRISAHSRNTTDQSSCVGARGRSRGPRPSPRQSVP